MTTDALDAKRRILDEFPGFLPVNPREFANVVETGNSRNTPFKTQKGVLKVWDGGKDKGSCWSWCKQYFALKRAALDLITSLDRWPTAWTYLASFLHQVRPFVFDQPVVVSSICNQGKVQVCQVRMFPFSSLKSCWAFVFFDLLFCHPTWRGRMHSLFTNVSVTIWLWHKPKQFI